MALGLHLGKQTLDPASILMLEVSRGLLLRFQTGNAGVMLNAERRVGVNRRSCCSEHWKPADAVMQGLPPPRYETRPGSASLAETNWFMSSSGPARPS